MIPGVSLLPPIEKFLSGEIKTLGWQVAEWCTTWLVNPDSYGGEKGAPWVFKPDQLHFLLAFYTLNDKGGSVYRRAYRERAKGTGKSPMVAAIACAEFLGPTKFSHFDANGNPIGVPHEDPIVWLAAISLDGSDHTYRYIMAMLEGEAERAYGLDIGMTRILQKGAQANKLIKQITASAKSHEGPKPTFVIAEETQNWTVGEHGPELMAVIHRGLMKTNGRRIEVTNAPVPGQGTVAEETHNYQKQISQGDALDDGLLFDTYSLHIEDIYDIEQAMPGLQLMYEHAPWINIERTFRDICDPSHSEVDSRRFFFNEMVQPSQMWVRENVWLDAQRPLDLKKTDLISLGFRIRKYCAAIVAVRLKDQAIFVLDLWERPSDAGRDWEVPYTKIDERMRRIFDRYNTYNLVASPENFQDIIGRWSIDHEGDVVVEELWVSRNRQKWADSIEAFETAVADQRLVHNGNPDLHRHINNCFVDEVTQGRVIRMETTHSGRYIVLAEAAVLAARASMEAIEDGALKERPRGVLYSF